MIYDHNLRPSSKLIRNSAIEGCAQLRELHSNFPDPLARSYKYTGALQHLVKGMVSESEKKT